MWFKGVQKMNKIDNSIHLTKSSNMNQFVKDRQEEH